jgi:hypothetical protein
VRLNGDGYDLFTGRSQVPGECLRLPSQDRQRAMISTVTSSSYTSARSPLSVPTRGTGAVHVTPALSLSLDPQRLSVGTLLDATDADVAAEGLQRLASGVGLPLDHRSISPALARGGTVGRIGVPQDAVAVMRRQRVLIGALNADDALAPVTRLWRGLQRRADVLVDLQHCSTAADDVRGPGTGARDLLLCTQRLFERATRRLSLDAESADQWLRARQVAEMAYRIATADGRQVLLVSPIGRGTEAQQLLSEAMHRQARQQRAAAPRTVKAGLLAALLIGDHTRDKQMIVSVMPMDELSALVTEAIGQARRWPVLSVGAETSFYTIQVGADGTSDFGALCHVLVNLAQRAGRPDLAVRLQQALALSTAAADRMREELGAPLHVPATALADAVLANLDRAAPGGAALQKPLPPDAATVTGVRVRVETILSAAAVRDQLTAALVPTGVEVASVRAVDAAQPATDRGVYDIRLRLQLGEVALGDNAGHALLALLECGARVLSVEPWIPGSTERLRPR